MVSEKKRKVCHYKQHNYSSDDSASSCTSMSSGEASDSNSGNEIDIFGASICGAPSCNSNGFGDIDNLLGVDEILSGGISNNNCNSNSIMESMFLGLSVGGGAKDINNFRESILNYGKLPNKSSITFAGVFYDYYFNTKSKNATKTGCKNKINHNDDTENKGEISEDIHEMKEDDNKNDDHLFYPKYCSAKCRAVATSHTWNDKKNTDTNDIDMEYYLVCGLNSNIKQNEFKRDKLNIIILLDVSGSMRGWKIKTAKKCLISLLDLLNKKEDRFGLVLFNGHYTVLQEIDFISNINLDELKSKINNINASGGTELEVGYDQATKMLIDLVNKNINYSNNNSGNNKNDSKDNFYSNRVIFLTDMIPNTTGNIGDLCENCANKHDIYTTFIGIGIDFNTSLVKSISNIKGCNYYSVKTSDKFKRYMIDEFDFMVTPIIFDLKLVLNTEGNSCSIDCVYGDNNEECYKDNNNDLFELKSIKTLFPSKSNKKGGKKGGIILIKLKANDNSVDKVNAELIVTYKDKYNNTYKNEQYITFDGNNNSDNDHDSYETSGIRKGILLANYVKLMQNWIDYETGINIDNNNNNTNSVSLNRSISNEYCSLFENFLVHFENEMKEVEDDKLSQEVKIIQKLIGGQLSLDMTHSDLERISSNGEQVPSIIPFEKDGIKVQFNFVKLSQLFQ